VRYLDISHPTLNHPIVAPAAPAKFVQVEVVEVENPAKVSLTFEVLYVPAGAQQIRLGMFSLFPADNPGKFIVPTHGNVTGEGSIVVSLVVADHVPTDVPLKVGIGKIALTASPPFESKR
jgi:hypothetical protein